MGSLLPDGWLAQVRHERDTLRRGRRCMSNNAIVEDSRRGLLITSRPFKAPHFAGAFDGAEAVRDKVAAILAGGSQIILN